MEHRAESPGPLLASGRAADVYDLGDGTVLRRYRRDAHDIDIEARVMEYVRARKFPVPKVVRAAGTDMVMERVDGPTMLEALERSPWRVLWYAWRLARLQRRLAAIAAPDWLLAPGVDPSSLGRAQSMLHLDLHPMNVIVSPRRGLHVIDWTNAAAGPAGFDGAMSYVLMSTANVPDDTSVGRLGQRVFVEAFRTFRGRRSMAPFLVAACDRRLADPGTEPDERIAVGALRARHTGR